MRRDILDDDDPRAGLMLSRPRVTRIDLEGAREDSLDFADFAPQSPTRGSPGRLIPFSDEREER